MIGSTKSHYYGYLLALCALALLLASVWPNTVAAVEGHGEPPVEVGGQPLGHGDPGDPAGDASPTPAPSRPRDRHPDMATQTTRITVI